MKWFQQKNLQVIEELHDVFLNDDLLEEFESNGEEEESEKEAFLEHMLREEEYNNTIFYNQTSEWVSFLVKYNKKSLVFLVLFVWFNDYNTTIFYNQTIVWVFFF